MRVEKILSREEVCDIVQRYLVDTGQIGPEVIVEYNLAGDGAAKEEWVNPSYRGGFPTVRAAWDEPAVK